MKKQELFGPRETLLLKISVRETRVKHAKGARLREETEALEALRAKLARMDEAPSLPSRDGYALSDPKLVALDQQDVWRIR